MYFYLYTWLVRSYKETGSTMNTPVSLAIGYIAGVGNMVLTTPIEVVATQLQNEPKGLVQTVQV